MLGQTVNNRGKTNTNYDEKSMWASSVMRRVILVQTIQATVISVKRNIFRM